MIRNEKQCNQGEAGEKRKVDGTYCDSTTSSQKICIQSLLSLFTSLTAASSLFTNCHIDSLSMKASRRSSIENIWTTGLFDVVPLLRSFFFFFFFEAGPSVTRGGGPGSEIFRRCNKIWICTLIIPTKGEDGNKCRLVTKQSYMSADICN